jgi:hypothetical protein
MNPVKKAYSADSGWMQEASSPDFLKKQQGKNVFV